MNSLESDAPDLLGATSTRFLYRGVADVLRQRMIDGSYSPGARIPSAADLATEFKVSTITVRRAIRDLTLQGALIGKQGLGVFVAQSRCITRSLSVDHIAPIEQDMLASGVRASLRDLGVTSVLPRDEVFLTALGRGQKTLFRLDRILLADGEPVGLDVLWITHRLAEKVADKMRGEFIMSLLEKRGVLVDQITYYVEAKTATDAEASALQVVPGFPLLVVRFFPTAQDGKLILVGQTTTRADRFTYQFGAKLRKTKLTLT